MRPRPKPTYAERVRKVATEKAVVAEVRSQTWSSWRQNKNLRELAGGLPGEFLGLLVTDAIERRGAARRLFEELCVVLIDANGKRRPAQEIEAEARAGLERLREEAK